MPPSALLFPLIVWPSDWDASSLDTPLGLGPSGWERKNGPLQGSEGWQGGILLAIFALGGTPD